MDGLTANLFGRYNRIMRGTFLGVLVFAGCLFYVQIDQSDQAVRARMANRLQESALALNFLLKASADNVDSLQIQAETWFATHPTAPEPPSPLYRQLIGSSQDGLFTLDRLSPPFTAELTGNLTAQARKPDARFRLEVEMALALNSRFHTIGRLLPNAAWVYYTSGNHFINLYPWVKASDFHYTDSLLEKEFFSGGRPEVDPGHRRFWTKAYVDEAGKGLMVTAAAPVYQETTFCGTVAIDLTLDELNRFVRNWSGGAGTLFIVNDHDQLLAHPQLVTSQASTVLSLADALPQDLRAHATEVMAAARDRLVQRGGYLVEAMGLEQAPFRLVLVVSHNTVMLEILRDAGLTVLGLLAGLALTLFISSRITLRDFIQPSQKLVDFIGGRLRGEPGGMPQVPAGWRPWFKTIDDVFADHAKLVSIQGELEAARTMQQAILPTCFPDRPELQLYACMLPAKEVGGDFYDFFWLAPGLLGVVIADVSGKGVPAALFMAVARTLIRATALGSDGPAACMRVVNGLLAEGNDSAMFVTVFYGVLDTASGLLTYANAGHTRPCLVDAAGQVSVLPGTGGVALGVVDDFTFAETSVSLRAGATILFYTDGVSEAFDPAENEFTEARLHHGLAGTHTLPVVAFVNRLVLEVETFAAGAPQADDLTCLALRYVGPGGEEGTT